LNPEMDVPQRERCRLCACLPVRVAAVWLASRARASALVDVRGARGPAAWAGRPYTPHTTHPQNVLIFGDRTAFRSDALLPAVLLHVRDPVSGGAGGDPDPRTPSPTGTPPTSAASRGPPRDTRASRPSRDRGPRLFLVLTLYSDSGTSTSWAQGERESEQRQGCAAP
jgi:hypothetical protein